MTAKQARIISGLIVKVCIACSIIGFVIVLGAAGTSDFYTMELHQPVPDNADLKMLPYGALFIGVATVGAYILRVVDFSEMYCIENIPVYLTKAVKRDIKKNTVFEMQVNNAFNSFYGGIWGDLDVVRINDNNEALECGVGAIVGLYHTTKGNIFIMVNDDRTRTEVFYEDEY